MNPSPVRLDDLSDEQRSAATLALDTLDICVNVPTDTRVAAVAQTTDAVYAGAQLQLTLPSAIHAEAAAISAAHSAGDLNVHTLYLAGRRFDGRDPGHVTPCGGCCQLIRDLATYLGKPITVLSLNQQAATALVFDSNQLLPFAFDSHRLRTAGEARQPPPWQRTRI